MCRREFTTSGIRCQGMGFALFAVSLRELTVRRAVLSLRLNTGRAVAGIGFRLS
jgi:hypothetical protein